MKYPLLGVDSDGYDSVIDIKDADFEGCFLWKYEIACAVRTERAATIREWVQSDNG